jgi:hypothetical protein
MMDLLDRFPVSVLKGMRDATARAEADEDGMITNTIPNLKRADAPFRVSTNKAEYLNILDAAIARRGAETDEAKQ